MKDLSPTFTQPAPCDSTTCPAPVRVNQSSAAILDQSSAAILDGNTQYAAFGHGTMVMGVDPLVKVGALNVPGGPIVDIDALYDALKDGTVLASGLDVLPEEPANPQRRLIDAWQKNEEWIRHRGLRVVVLFEGRDTAGKGGLISDQDFTTWIDWLNQSGELKGKTVKLADLYTNAYNAYRDGGTVS